MHRKGAIVVVDDDTGVLKRIDRMLRFEGYQRVVLCENAEEARKALMQGPAYAMVLDLLMPGTDGYAVLEEMRRDHPDVPVIVATAVDDLDVVVRCMKAGAFDYVPKSAESARLLASIDHAARIRGLQEDNRALKDSLLSGDRPPAACFSAILTRDRRMTAIFRYIEAIARSDKPILVTGESGTGKELIAASIHAASGRPGRFVAVNIAGLDDTMFSDTLFGHRRGAFTGADSDRAGLIEQAAGGTLFLDEIGDLAPQSQVKLLRLIEQRLYYPLGSDLNKASDALVVAATNRDLRAACASGGFRQDLYYRLETHRVALPPLRDRPADLPLLVERFVEVAAAKFAKKAPLVPAELYDLLGAYAFPGNVRELESMVHDAVGRTEGKNLPLESFKARIFTDDAPNPRPRSVTQGLYSNLPVLPTLREASDELVREALSRAGDNQGVAAGLLGMSRTSLNRRLKPAPGDDEDSSAPG